MFTLITRRFAQHQRMPMPSEIHRDSQFIALSYIYSSLIPLPAFYMVHLSAPSAQKRYCSLSPFHHRQREWLSPLYNSSGPSLCVARNPVMWFHLGSMLASLASLSSGWTELKLERIFL